MKHGTMVCMLAAVLAVSACSPFSEAEAEVRKALKDPGSAQFRNEVVYTEGIVCGEVNGKNGFGTYTGFKPFTYNGNVYIDDAVKWGEWCNNRMGKRVASLQRALAREKLACADETQDAEVRQVNCKMISITQATIADEQKKIAASQ